MDTSASKAVVVPPFCEEPFTASRTPKTSAPKARHRIEDHPTKRRDVERYRRVKQAYGDYPNYKHDWRVA